MKLFSLRRNFKQLGYISPQWQRARIFFKSPINHLKNIHGKIKDTFPIWKKVK